MAKESRDRIVFRFQPEELSFDHQARVKLAGDVILILFLYLLAWDDFVRVRRQVDDLEAAISGLYLVLDRLNLVGDGAIYFPHAGLLCLQFELLQEPLQHLGADHPYMAHELHSAFRFDCKDLLDLGLRAVSTYDGCLPQGSHGGAEVLVAMPPRLVSKEHTSAIALGMCHKFGRNLFTPIGDEHRGLFPCFVQRVLNPEAQSACHLAYCLTAELDFEFAHNDLGYETQRLEAEAERELVGAMLACQEGRAAQLHDVDRQRAVLNLLGYQSACSPSFHKW